MTKMLDLEALGLDTLAGQRVFVRVDFNVPLEGGRVTDTARLEAALPTLNELRQAGAKLVLASHCGRPKGERKSDLSLRPVAAELAKMIGTPVLFAEDCVGPLAISTVEQLAPGEICLLENLRFHPGEKENEPAFVDQLAALADAYVNDAFGTAHRAHASVVGVAERIARKAAGRLLVREVEVLSRLLAEPDRPFAAVVGGAKIADKAETLSNLLPRLDTLALGGAMANTFLAARGRSMGRSLVEEDRFALARDILERAGTHGVEVLLPRDLVATDDLESPARVETIGDGPISDDLSAVDIGTETRREFANALAKSRTIFWNGPLGVFERPPFDEGTLAVAAATAASPGYSVIGGGETVAAVRRAGVVTEIDHVSTGGGASLELLAGKTLPGVIVLEDHR